ncbi:InaA protein [Pseudomonas alcaligenes]|uniref:Lipopolisaccharide kinase n=2 Tax=Pseudomonadaceae TaxID=135621 RepID=A0A1V0M093_ECTOL|nr:lipopolysaccharide kinase InaA family protein [Pseudomonas alcaligenes]ARD68220.1 lipopolisaccharide kinase [Pseudomonas oleovorans]MBC9252072.1 InaA protein [Pseudomonas alcaligenes]
MVHGTAFGLTGEKAGQFEEWWRLQGEWVEIPNQRRGGESGVQRLQKGDGPLLYAKRQVGHLYRDLLHPFGRPTVLRERDALLGLSRLGVRVPRLVYCGASHGEQGWRALLVSEELEGFQDILSWYASGGREQCGEAVHTQLLQQIGATLARMHGGRWQHGCLYSKHVFVKVGEEGPQVALLDLEKCRQRLSRLRAARHDLRQLRRHSSWSEAEWQQLIYGYEQVFGGTIKGL